jgi:hypothetical protein
VALTFYDARFDVSEPAWSADGARIAFTLFSSADQAGGLAFVPAAGGAVTQMPYDPLVGARGASADVFARAPDWQPG